MERISKKQKLIDYAKAKGLYLEEYHPIGVYVNPMEVTLWFPEKMQANELCLSAITATSYGKVWDRLQDYLDEIEENL